MSESKFTWHASDILDNGVSWGLVNGQNQIIVGWSSGLTMEAANTIAQEHNQIVKELTR